MQRLNTLLKRLRALHALLALHAERAKNPLHSGYCAHYREQIAETEAEIRDLFNAQ